MGTPPPSDGQQQRAITIFAPSSAVKADFDENFETYVAFLQAFRDKWDSLLLGTPAGVTETNRSFVNVDSTGTPNPAAGNAPSAAKYNVFSAEVDKLIKDAQGRGWIKV